MRCTPSRSPPARQRPVDPRERPRVRVTVGAGELRGPPRASVHDRRDDQARIAVRRDRRRLRVDRVPSERPEHRVVGRELPVGAARVVLGSEPDEEVDIERIADLLAHERAGVTPVDAVDHLTDEVTEAQRVVAVLRARFVLRPLRLDRRDDRVPVEDTAGRQLGADLREPGLVAHHVADRDRLLAVRRELRPVRRDWRVVVEQPALGEHVRAQCRHALGARRDADDRVALPGPGPRAVAPPGPQVDGGTAVDHHGDRGTHLGRSTGRVALELRGERVAHGLEARRAGPVHLDRHCSPPRCLAPVTWTVSRVAGTGRRPRWLCVARWGRMRA